MGQVSPQANDTRPEIKVSPHTSHVATESDPYFLVRKRDGAIETSGVADAEFGHQLPSTIGSAADGVFAGWHWDGTQLVVENDRYGFYPLFWFRLADGGVCVSPSLDRLIEHGAPTGFDLEALAVFFRLGYFLGNDTPFSAIKVVPPNAVFEWKNGELTCNARYPRIPKVSSIARDEAIDRYIDLFAAAMARRAPSSGKFAVPISGGRDSRHILLELHRTGIDSGVCVSAMDNPPDPNQDPEIAKLLCAELGFKHVIVDQRLSVLHAELRKNRETHFCASAHGWYLALADFLNGHFACVYDGIAGDVLSQSSFLDPSLHTAFRSRNKNTISTELLSRHASAYSALKGILKGRLKQALDPEIAKERLAREVQRHIDMPNPIASFIFWNRTRREIALAPYSLLKGISNVHAPYLDHALFDFLTTLPADMLMDRTFHSDAIARAYPAFAHIPYADKLAPRTDDRDTRARFLAEVARRFLLRKPSSLMNNTIPRAKILAGLLSGGHIKPWISPWIIYLDQIESIIDRRGSGARMTP